MNRIANGNNQNGVPFVNPNQSTLDKLTQENNQLLFNNNKLGKPLSIIEINNEDLLSSSSDSSDSTYNKQFENVQKIIFNGAIVQINPYNPKQIVVNIDRIQNHLGDENVILSNYYNVKQINRNQYNASSRDFLICNIQSGGTVIKLPNNSADKSYIKIATLQNINSLNKVIITVAQPQVFIHRSNNLILQLQHPFSSVELIYSASYRIWRIITPFVPIEKSTQGLTQSEVKKMTKKYLNIFG